MNTAHRTASHAKRRYQPDPGAYIPVMLGSYEVKK